MKVRRQTNGGREARRINAAIKRYAAASKVRARIRRRYRNAQACRSGYIAKGNTILAGKGRHGRTMNERLLLQHGIQRKEGGAA